MENTSSRATFRQPSHYHNQTQQQQSEQQNQAQHQQFCLRWHNHQTSLLSTLPILLDQSHLTDVTLSAEGRTLRAHRVVLSACSTFFLELFRTLDSTNHPVIVIPGASFAAIVALLTFMYSGEVNVFEEQIPMLLNLAETLGVKGLADVQSNLQNSTKRRDDEFPANTTARKGDETPPSPPSPQPLQPPPPPPLPPPPIPPRSISEYHHQQQQQQQQLSDQREIAALAQALPTIPNKMPSPLESFFLKSLQFYPNLLPQPLNFSQSALNKTSEFLAKYHQHCNSYQSGNDQLLDVSGGSGGGGVTPKNMFIEQTNTNANNAELFNKRTCTGEKKQQKDIKRIDRIVENLRSSSTNFRIKTEFDNILPNVTAAQQQQHQQQPSIQYPHQNVPNLSSTTNASRRQSLSSTLLHTNSPIFTSTSLHGQQQLQQQHHQQQQQQKQQQQEQKQQQQHEHQHEQASIALPEEKSKLQQTIEQQSSSHFLATTNSRATPENTIKTESNSQFDKNNKTTTNTSTPPQSQLKSSANSKLYATCFICHKQLSNQYNLRVHLETHQNVRYACSVCSHVSRSKDALRKHVSYRHPGAPSPCESEARRKRAKSSTSASPSSSSASSLATGTLAISVPYHLAATSPDNDQTQIGGVTPAVSINPAYMFIPNQFQLAAAAANLPIASTITSDPKTVETITTGTTTSTTTGTTSPTVVVANPSNPTFCTATSETISSPVAVGSFAKSENSNVNDAKCTSSENQ